MARTGFIFFWIVVAPTLAFAASTPKAPLQLDNDSWGDLILYSSGHGTFTNVYHDLGPSERFVYVTGQWPVGFTVTAARLNNDNRADAFLYNDQTGGSHSTRNFYLFERNHAAFPEQLTLLLQARYPKQSLTVVNAGRPGELAFFARPRLESAIAANAPDLVLLFEGTNDINAGFTASQISASLNDLARTVLNKGVKVRIATLTPIGLAYDPTGETNRLVQSVNAQITTVASTLGIGTPVDLYAAISRDSSLLGSDGLHPSDAGYGAMANAFLDAIVSAFQILK